MSLEMSQRWTNSAGQYMSWGYSKETSFHMWLVKAKGLMVTCLTTKGKLTWSPRSISSLPRAPLLTLSHPEKTLSLLCASYL